MDYLLLPANSTGLLQPIDVGVGKSLKGHIRDKFTEFLKKNLKKKVTKHGKTIDTFVNPTNDHVIDWALDAYDLVKTVNLIQSTTVLDIF